MRSHRFTAPYLDLTSGENRNGSAPIHNGYPNISSRLCLDPAHFYSKQFSPDTHSVELAQVISVNQPGLLFMSNLPTLHTLDQNVLSSKVDISRQPQLIVEQAIVSEDFSSQEESKSRVTMQEKSKRLCSHLLKWLLAFFDLKICLDTGFIIICASCVVFQLAYFIPFTYFLLFATKQAGIAENDVLLLVTITGIQHTLGRLVGGTMANIPGVDIITVAAVSCIICAICHFTLPFLPHSFAALALYCSGFGFLCGKFMNDILAIE